VTGEDSASDRLRVIKTVREPSGIESETQAACDAVGRLLSDTHSAGGRIGVVWVSSNSGADAYLHVLERLGNPRKRAIVKTGPLSGGNAVVAAISVKHRLTGPSVSIFGADDGYLSWLAAHYLKTDRAELIILGRSTISANSLDITASLCSLAGRTDPGER
jgi:hypothetical protein